MFWRLFGRAEIILGVSKATYCEELDFEVRFYAAPQNPDKNTEKQISETKQIRKKKFGCRNIKCRGSSETCFAEV